MGVDGAEPFFRRASDAPHMAVPWTLRGALLVAVGGALGCVLRYFVGAWLTRDDYPRGTLAVNLVGSLLMALLMFGALERGLLGPDARLLLVTGVLGGFTTMSSFAYETGAFLDDGEYWRATGYVALTVLGSLGMMLLGRAIVRALPGA